MLYKNTQMKNTQIKNTQSKQLLKKGRGPSAKDVKPAEGLQRLEHEEVIKVGAHMSRCRFQHEPGQGYTVTSVDLGTTHIFAETLAEAREQARDTISLWLDATGEDPLSAFQEHDRWLNE